MVERIPTMFKVLKESTVYPCYRGGNGFVENLTSYRENVVLRDKEIMIEDALQFDIERLVSWDSDYKLYPFTYSMMIDGFYPISRLPFKR